MATGWRILQSSCHFHWQTFMTWFNHHWEMGNILSVQSLKADCVYLGTKCSSSTPACHRVCKSAAEDHSLIVLWPLTLFTELQWMQWCSDAVIIIISSSFPDSYPVNHEGRVVMYEVGGVCANLKSCSLEAGVRGSASKATWTQPTFVWRRGSVLSSHRGHPNNQEEGTLRPRELPRSVKV